MKKSDLLNVVLVIYFGGEGEESPLCIIHWLKEVFKEQYRKRE
jgi:hypothetical protein